MNRLKTWAGISKSVCCWALVAAMAFRLGESFSSLLDSMSARCRSGIDRVIRWSRVARVYRLRSFEPLYAHVRMRPLTCKLFILNPCYKAYGWSDPGSLPIASMSSNDGWLRKQSSVSSTLSCMSTSYPSPLKVPMLPDSSRYVSLAII